MKRRMLISLLGGAAAAWPLAARATANIPATRKMSPMANKTSSGAIAR